MYIGTRIEYIHTLLGHIYCNDWTLVQLLVGGVGVGGACQKNRSMHSFGERERKRNTLHHSEALTHTSKVQTMDLELRRLFSEFGP